MPIVIDKEKCSKDPDCRQAGHSCPAAASCPMGALTQKDTNSPPEVDVTKCAECGLCITLCPNGAITKK